MALTGRLVALAALGILLVGVPAGLAAYAGALVVAVVADVLLAARIAEVQLQRDELAPVRLGADTQSVLRLRNVGRRTLRAQVRDAWVPSAGARPRAQWVSVPPGEPRRLATALHPTRRGIRPAAQVTIRSFGPMRLAARQRRVTVGGELQVLPAFPSRRFLPEKLSRLRQIDGAAVAHRRGQGSEFDSLRGYVLGDDVRAIDWRASARAHEVVVRTWRPERDRHIVLAIDTGRTSAARIGDEPRLDAALDACLLLGAVAARAGDRVALVAADIAVRARLAPTAGRDVLPKLVAALTPLEPALVETDPQLLAAEVRRRVRTRSLVVLFTTLDAVSPDSGVLATVRALAARHEVIVAAADDPRLAELAAARATAAEAYPAAAAERAIGQQAAVTERLVRLGAHVVAASSEVLASRVTDAYLDLKAAGRL